MGGCMCRASNVIVSREHLQQAIIAAVDENDVQTLLDLHHSFLRPQNNYVLPSLSLDDPMISIQGFPLSPLSYAFRLGHKDTAKYLIESAHCDLCCMYEQYKAAGKTPVQILCEYGHLELLTYFLPKHLARGHEPESIIQMQDQYDEMSIFLDAEQRAVRDTMLSQKASSSTQTSIQKACEYGHVEVVKFLVAYFRSHNPVPFEFDLNAEDEKTGENCALIVCRIGNLELAEFLFKECEADFHKTTKRKESALQLAVLGGKLQKQGKFLACVEFLIETVKVDITYEYEETLLICEDSEIQLYLEEKLREAGIQTSKKKVEEANFVGRARGGVSASYREFEERARQLGENIQLTELIHKELDSSLLSSITPKSVTPFSFLSRNLTPDQVLGTPQ